ncbi:unnamed protein product [Owenia fusiformis]|uniref:Protein LTV1 homolog n=1 Tax=Owenia fusiformis TaxID=6347 RepID=A0A8S4N3V4_OWEFU|nr:unnamed protein product [Owenia fusiformis]
MPGRKKRFIDKKNAVTFHLVHRSQRDPLQADEDASKHVLLPVEGDVAKRKKEEERKFGVFYDDDYDYMQHLRDVDEINQVEPVQQLSRGHKEDIATLDVVNQKEKKLNLPSSAFASEVETDVGLLNKAAPLRGPQLDWDPDIVAALDEDFDYEDEDNLLDDDFVVKANEGEILYDEDEPRSSEDEEWEDVEDEDDKQKVDKVNVDEEKGFASDEAEDDFSEDGSWGQGFSDEETKSRFTAYSMTSSVVHRNKGLTLLDDRFEKLYEEYDETEIGALDHEEIDGHLQQNSDLLNLAMNEFEKQQDQILLKDVIVKGNPDDVQSSSDSEDNTQMITVELDMPKKEWDCESILSTYSTLYNHPKTIELPKKDKPIKLTKRMNIPDDAIPTRGLTKRQIEEEMKQGDMFDKASTYRPKGETPEERKARKEAIKAERKERRVERKMNKNAFKEENKRQQKEVMNLKRNLQGDEFKSCTDIVPSSLSKRYKYCTML